MRETVNCEGLTFEEWVCAAGVALICRRNHQSDDIDIVKPYTESYQYAIEHDAVHYTLSGGCFTDPRKLKRRTVRWYPVKIRQAWKNGEDPTEYRV